MNSQLKEFIATCEVCNSYQKNNQKETLMSHSIPSTPWSKIGCDIFEWNKGDYLIVFVYYNNYNECQIKFDKMKNQTAVKTIDLMQKKSARWGLLMTDHGKNFDSTEFYHFCHRKKVKSIQNLHLIIIKAMARLHLQ